MLFTSYEFIGFIFILLILYYIIPRKAQWPLLLVASYIFYFIAGPKYIIYILATTVTTYICAVIIEKNQLKEKKYIKEHKKELSLEEKKSYKAKGHTIRFRILVLCLVINIGLLVVLKYANFFISNINSILNLFGGDSSISAVSLILPLGISYYTLRSMGYLLDVYRETIPAEKNFFKFALFVSFFPLLVQGPITRYDDLSKTLYEEHKFNSKNLFMGLQRVLWGFFKKLVIADRLLIAVNTIIDDPSVYNGAYTIVLIVFYTIELYADFTGGIDITIGISEALGITVAENFDRPFASKSLKEYWRRWHITMGTWFKDYIFYPVSVCKPMLKFSKFSKKHFGEKIGKKLPVYLSSFIVWFLTGIWHGSSWNFIVWGLANWFILMVSEELEPTYDRFKKKFRYYDTKGYCFFQVARTTVLISMLKLFDCYSSVKTIFSMFASVFTTANWSVFADGSLLNLGLTISDYCILLFGIVLFNIVSALHAKGSVREKIAGNVYPVRVCIWFALFLLVLLLGVYGIGYDSSQFIYNRF